jgi:aryl-alcohol dehydrogenase-like predicted oxidoreductase
MTVTIERLSAIGLGKIGPVVGAQGLGCMAMATGYYGAQDNAKAIPGTRRPSRVEENAAGAAIVLDDREIGALDRLAQVVKGDRGRQI